MKNTLSQTSKTRAPDPIDLKIIQALLADGRLSNARLAERVGLAPTPCWQRVRRLENEGYILGYAAILNQEILGASEAVIVGVTLERHDDAAIEIFGLAMAAMPEVVEVYLTTGHYDYFIKVAVNLTSGLEEFLRNKLYGIPGIRFSQSIFALRCHKQSHSPTPS